MISILCASITAVGFNIVNATPVITVSPTSGPPGSTATVTGTGFPPNTASISILFDLQLVNTTSSDSTGAFSKKITISSTATVGSHTISADYGGPTPINTQFTVTAPPPSITLTPSTGAAGTTVTVSGSNFGATKTITIKFDNSVIATNPPTVTSSNTGTFSSATITIPSTATAGNHTVSATDGTLTASGTFTVVTTAITLSPTSGAAGTVVTVSGTNFAASATITIKFDNAIITTSPSVVSASSTGSFSATITIPSTATAGNHTISATDNTKTQSATFTILATAITLSPTSGNAGSTVTVKGVGFTPSASITIKFDTSPLATTPTSLAANSSGGFSASATISSAATVGSHTISASDITGKTATATFTVSVLGIITLSPTSGSIGASVTVTGSNFNPNSAITIKFDTSPLATTPAAIATTATGTFTATITIPLTASNGAHTITTTDASGATGSATFRVVGGGIITLSPAFGTTGTVVQATGSNFTANTPVHITFGKITVATTPSPVITGTVGGFFATFNVPAGVTGGNHTVIATDDTGKIGAAIFTVQGIPSITLSPTSGTVGTAVTVAGSSFAPNTAVSVKLDSTALTTNPATITTTSLGAFTATITIPSVSAGAHTVTVTVGTDTASAAFSVTQASITNKIGLSQMQLVDQSGAALSRASVGMQVLIQSNLANSLSTDQQFAYIVQIKDSAGATVMISWMTGTLPANKQYTVAQSWLAENKGDYTAEVFVWQSLSNPVILAPSVKTNFSVQ